MIKFTTGIIIGAVGVFLFMEDKNRKNLLWNFWCLIINKLKDVKLNLTSFNFV